MTAEIHYFHDHSHRCDCGGWRHEAVDCEYEEFHPCPHCDIELGLVPGASGTQIVVDEFGGYFRLAYEGE